MANQLYGELDDIKPRLGFDDSSDDLMLGAAHTAACRQIDLSCGQRFWQDETASQMLFMATSPLRLDVTEGPAGDTISTTTGLVVEVDADDDGTFETTLGLNTDFILGPLNADKQVPVLPWTEIQLLGNAARAYFRGSVFYRPTIRVTARWGWPEVPDAIVEAAIIQTIHLFKSGKEAQTGALFFAGGDAVGALRVSQLHPLARGLIAPYQRPAVG